VGYIFLEVEGNQLFNNLNSRCIKCVEYSLIQISIRLVEMYFPSYLPATCFDSYNWKHLQAELVSLICTIGMNGSSEMYILRLGIQTEDGSNCSNRNMLLEDMTGNTFQ
jgi:hypothetical protein